MLDIYQKCENMPHTKFKLWKDILSKVLDTQSLSADNFHICDACVKMAINWQQDINSSFGGNYEDVSN